MTSTTTDLSSSQINNNKVFFTNNPPVTQPEVMSDEEIKKALNVPPRDEKTYPEASKEKQIKAGSFIYKLNAIASGADGNLQSLVWDMYDKMDDFLRLDKPNSSISLAMALETLKIYIQGSNNILFRKDEDDDNNKEIQISSQISSS